MTFFRSKTEMRAQTRAWHAQGLRVGFAPTMGALHEGHVSLMHLAARHADRVVVSIFVNPTQFGPNEDFARYPRDEEGDLAKCRGAGVHAVFLPSVPEMYPPDATVHIDESTLSLGLCGASRPGHFRGVLTVVAKLLNIVEPDVAVFGRKDAQQLALIERMVRDLDMSVRILPAPILREPDGLAMSSRNRYLSPQERLNALCLRRALDHAEAAFRAGAVDAAALALELRARIEAVPGTRIDYVEIVDASSLAPVATLHPNTLVALAVRVGATRLIDNTVLGA
jgi:pantoate--beta-alanine ligase